MTRYWVVAPVESKPSGLFDKVWQYDLANNLISIGWKQLGNVSTMSRETLCEAVASSYPDRPPQTKGLYVNMIWAFYHEMSEGDFVIARRGRKSLAAVGRVTRRAFYAPGTNPNHGHPNFLEVSWGKEPRDKSFASVVFPMHTLAEITETRFREFIEGTGLNGGSDPELDTTGDPTEFVLEKYLEEFIVGNFDKIFKGSLKIYEDGDGNDGQQYDTEIGRIDILAVEPLSRAFVVIELKKGRPSDQVVGQILRYMGWVKKNRCEGGQDVKGLIICRTPDPKLSYALAMTDKIDIRYYNMSFTLSNPEGS